MSDGGYKCFKKRDFGQIIYLTVAVCLLALGVLLLIQKDIGNAHLMLALKIILVACGFGIVVGYFTNLRTRFRPCWTLPLGIITTLIGAGLLLMDTVELETLPAFNIEKITMIVAFTNSCLLLSTAVQIFSLRLKRWIFHLAFSLISFAFSIFYFSDLFLIRTNAFVGCSVLMFIIASQLIMEGVIDLLKTVSASKKFASEVNG